MKITDVETYVIEAGDREAGAWAGTGHYHVWLLLKLLTDSGIHGWGECVQVPFGPEVAEAMIKDFVQTKVTGKDPHAIEELFHSMYFHGYGHQADCTKMAIISGVEMACWDIKGKDLVKPVYELLGGKVREKLRTYTYVYGIGGEKRAKKRKAKVKDLSPEDRAELDAEMITECLDAGFTAVKLDPIGGARALKEWGQTVPVNLDPESLSFAELRFKKMREAVGDKMDIGIGTHGQMSSSSAIRLAKRLEQFDPFFFEEPVPPENIDEMAEVAKKTSIRIATGERLSTLYEYNDVLKKGAARLLQFDLGRMGGILQGKKAAAIAEAYYAHFQPHYWGGPVLQAANIQLDTCCLNFEVQECLGKMEGLWSDILIDPIEWKNGFIIPSDRPGLGYEINETVANKHKLN